jgi:hypothetical protein
MSKNPFVMRKKYCTLFALLSIVLLASAQESEQCFPDYSKLQEAHQSKKIVHSNASLNALENEVPLKFHIVRNGAATFDDTTHVADLITLANDVFEEINVQFAKCGGINFIDNSPMAEGYDPTTVKNQLHDTHGVPNVINVYVTNTLYLYGGYSFAGPLNDTEHFIQDNAIVMSGTQYVDYDTVLLLHELGHYFGLFHPSVITFGLELVDGSNCEIAGDFCCDTPAARGGMCCNSNCEFVASPEVIYDSQGDPINPDIKNIMSDMAFALVCREYFTTDQYERMAYYYENFLSDMSCGNTGMATAEHSVAATAVKLFHDAASDELHIELTSDESCRLQLYDITGALVCEKNLQDSDVYYVDTKTLKSGIYMVSIDFSQEDKLSFQTKVLLD